MGEITNRYRWGTAQRAVLPCLLESSSREAFDIAGTIRGVESWIEGSPLWVDQYFNPGETIRRWLARHPEQGFSYLADGGPSAGLALRAMFTPDPRGTQRRLRAQLGKNTADGLLAAHALVVPTIPKPVRDALRVAPGVKLPRSGSVTVADVVLLFENFQGPAWDNDSFLTSAMRLTGFVSPGGQDGLVFQSLVAGPSGVDLRIEFHTVGFGIPPGRTVENSSWVILQEDTLDELHESGGTIEIALANGSASVNVPADNNTDDDEQPFAVDELIAITLGAATESRDRVFLTSEQLFQRLSLPHPQIAFFEWDQWDHPASGQSPTESLDLQLAVEALRRRKQMDHPITTTTWTANLQRRQQSLRLDGA